MQQPAPIRRILVVEDEPGVARVCLRSLTREGWEVDIAADGMEARDRLANGYDLLLLDVRTPGMNGKELYEYIVSHHPDLPPRVIFTSGDVDSKTQQFIDRTECPFLPKPFTPDELRAVIRESAGNSRR